MTDGERRSTPEDRTDRGEPLAEALSPLAQREVTDVLAVLFQDVVGHEDHRDGLRHLRHLLLAADALLQRREEQRPLVAERQHLAVEHGSVGQVSGGRGDLRESMGNQLLAARPQMDRPRALHQLRADAVPFPLENPVRRLAQRRRLLVQGRRQEERIRTRPIDVRRLHRRQRHEPLGRRRPFAHQARRDGRDRNAGGLGQRPHDQRLRHADAQLTGDHLQQHETLQPVERRPPLGDLAALLVRTHVAKREDPRLHPLRKRQRRGVFDGWQLIEDERRGLGTVADHRIRFLDQPRGQVRIGQRPVVDRRIGDEPLQPAAGEKEHHPCRIRRRRLAEVARHRRDLGVGGGRRVDFVEEGCEADHVLSGQRSRSAFLVARGAPPPRDAAGPHPRGCQRSLRSAPLS